MMIRSKATKLRSTTTWLIIFVSWAISTVEGTSDQQALNLLNTINSFEGLLKDGGSQLLTSISKDYGDHLKKKQFEDGALAGILNHFIQLFRQGLIASNATNLNIPNFDVEVEGNHGHATVHATNSQVVGLTDFEIKNLSANAIRLEMAMGIQLPVLEFRGTYTLEGKLAGFLPIWGGGFYSLKFRGMEISADGHYKPPTLRHGDSIQIFDPYFTLGNAWVKTAGVVAESELTELIVVGVAIILFYTIIIVLITLCSIKIGQRKLNRGYTQIPETVD